MLNTYHFDCPYCTQSTNYRFLNELYPINFVCCNCYKPLIQNRKNGPIKKRRETILKTAFLIHSATANDKIVLNWLRETLRLYGFDTFTIEEDSRTKVWLHKSQEGIDKYRDVFAFLTKRYQYLDDLGELKWKGPDKCYDEIAMAFMRTRNIYALIEKEVDPGKILDQITWCYFFEY